MIYRLRSPATEDLLMLGPVGDELLRLIGREPAAQGIIEPAAMAAAIAALMQAVERSESGAATPKEVAGDAAADAVDAADAEDATPAVGLRQRVWPLVEMLRRAQAAGAAVVWGV
jgi:hypothetical protein